MWEAKGEGLLWSWTILNYILKFGIIKQEQNKANKNPQPNKKRKQNKNQQNLEFSQRVLFSVNMMTVSQTPQWLYSYITGMATLRNKTALVCHFRVTYYHLLINALVENKGLTRPAYGMRLRHLGKNPYQ